MLLLTFISVEWKDLDLNLKPPGNRTLLHLANTEFGATGGPI
jgi:hypothetical protein